jgi:hypothetical protein
VPASVYDLGSKAVTFLCHLEEGTCVVWVISDKEGDTLGKLVA